MNKLSSESYLHPLPGQAIGIPLPVRFTYPFHYTPHPLVRLAAEEVLHYLSTRNDWQEELQQGKMFGVLIVQQADGSCGYLAAFPAIWPEATCTHSLCLLYTTCCSRMVSSG